METEAFTPTDLYGMFQIKEKTVPFWILRDNRVNSIYNIFDLRFTKHLLHCN